MERKKVVVLGLGIFGSTLARDLSRYNFDVIGTDKDMECVERVSGLISKAVCIDFTDLEVLKEIGAEGADIGVVSTGSNLEDSIMGILNLKELGVPHIIAKAKNKKYSEVLKKIGADATVSPDKDTAKHVAKRLSSRDIIELFDIDNEYTIFDIKVVKSWIGHNLVELDLRKKYDLNVIGVRRDGKLLVNFDPKEPLKSTDEILIVGNNKIFEDLRELS